MKTTGVVFLFVCLLVFSCCKKDITTSYIANSATPSIIGKWAMTNFSGTVYNYNSTGPVFVEYDSYDSNTKVFTSAYNVSPTKYNYFDTIFFQFTTEAWTFKADGTYMIDEYYTKGPNWAGPLDTTSYVFTGAWEYVSNAKDNTAFALGGDPAFSFEDLITNFMESTMYNIQSVSNTTLVITRADTSTGFNSSYTVTFTKQ